jgi:hypothetical protein
VQPSRKGLIQGWQTPLWLAVIALALVPLIRTDLAHLRWVSELSMQGGPPPARDADSSTGYALGQRHFIGIHERGETYRWIAATQDAFASGLFAANTYEADTVPTGRPQLSPRLYTAWLAAITWSLHVITEDPIGICAEHAALWEPVVAHLLAFAGIVFFMAHRYGLASAAISGWFFVLFPPLALQFLPGVLTPRTAALFIAAYAIALNLPRPREGGKSQIFRVQSAIASGFALWLDPALGFPAVLISAAAGVSAYIHERTVTPVLRWSVVGAFLTVLAWLVDRNPWNPAAGELRTIHPLYALAWLGIGLAFDGVQRLREVSGNRRLRLCQVVGGTLLFAALIYTQVANDYKAWLYPSVWIRRLSSVNETAVFSSYINWLGRSSLLEVLLISAPVLAALTALAVSGFRGRSKTTSSNGSALTAVVVLVGLLLLAFLRIRWGVVATLIALPLLWHLSSRDLGQPRRALLIGASVFMLGLGAWSTSLPPAFQRPSAVLGPSATDLEALVHRHFSHWLAAHTPGQNVSAVAPPDLSDSLVFHGNRRVLMSSAWESYPGQVAATRLFSALESTEADAVLQSHGITHVILPSWDKVLPLFVQKPTVEGQDTLFDRLQRWVHPPFLRPMPYRLPPIPAFSAEKMAVFKVTPPQDDALSLSRLAEYFVEMERTEPATLAAKVLAESFADDPNAAIARALVYVKAGRDSEFNQQAARLAADLNAGRVPSDWDRRVQRAIVFALARRHDIARAEIAASLENANADALLELTPLQAHRLTTLAKGYRLSFPSEELSRLAGVLGAEYSRSDR